MWRYWQPLTLRLHDFVSFQQAITVMITRSLLWQVRIWKVVNFESVSQESRCNLPQNSSGLYFRTWSPFRCNMNHLTIEFFEVPSFSDNLANPHSGFIPNLYFCQDSLYSPLDFSRCMLWSLEENCFYPRAAAKRNKYRHHQISLMAKTVVSNNLVSWASHNPI